MPTVTTTVTSASATGSTKTVTTTEATPENLGSYDGVLMSWVVALPIEKVAPYMKFNALGVTPVIKDGFAGIEDTGASIGSTRTITLADDAGVIVEQCIAADDNGYSYAVTDGHDIFGITPNTYRGTFSCAKVSDSTCTVTWSNTFMSTNAVEAKAGLEAFIPMMTAAWTALEAAAGSVLDTKWPKFVEDISNEWLSALMGRTVTGFDQVILGNGVLSDACILTLKYDAADSRTARAASVVLKYAKANDGGRAAAMVGRSYEKEIKVYRDLKADINLKLPDIYGIWTDPAAPNEWFCIAMEDLCVHNDVCNQIVGITYEDQYRLITDVANFNGQNYHNTHLLEMDWIKPQDPQSFKPWFGAWFDAYSPAGFAQALVDVKRHDEVRVISCNNNDDPYILKLIAFMEGPKGQATIQKVYENWSARPMTLLHGDARADNIFKAKEGGAFTIIDWQMITAGPIGCELLQLCSASMTNPEDYKKMHTLVEHYYTTVMAAAPDMEKDYPLQLVKDDFAISCALLYFGGLSTLGPMFATLPLDNDLWSLIEAWIPRIALTMVEMKTLDVLEGIAKTI